MKVFLKIVLLTSFTSCTVLCMEGAGVSFVFPIDKNNVVVEEIGLQQKLPLWVDGVGPDDDIKIFPVTSDGETVTLCASKKKNHEQVMRVFDDKQIVGGARKFDVTFYCKGMNSGGCRKKKAAQVKLKVIIYHENNNEVRYTNYFFVKGNRRAKTDNNKSYSHNEGSRGLKRRCADEPITSARTSLVNDQNVNANLPSFVGNNIHPVSSLLPNPTRFPNYRGVQIPSAQRPNSVIRSIETYLKDLYRDESDIVVDLTDGPKAEESNSIDCEE